MTSFKSNFIFEITEMLENGEIPLGHSTTTTKVATSTAKQTTQTMDGMDDKTTSAPHESQTTQKVAVVNSTTVTTATTTRAAGPAILFGCNFEVSKASLKFQKKFKIC